MHDTVTRKSKTMEAVVKAKAVSMGIPYPLTIEGVGVRSVTFASANKDDKTVAIDASAHNLPHMLFARAAAQTLEEGKVVTIDDDVHHMARNYFGNAYSAMPGESQFIDALKQSATFTMFLV